MSSPQRYAVVDLETTGGNPITDRVIEVGIVISDGYKIVETFDSLIDPGIPVPPFISKITGIRDEMLTHAPDFRSISDRILEKTEGCCFVAHNASFDYNFLKKEFKLLNLEFDRQVLCSYRTSRKLIKGAPSYGLSNLSNHLNIELKNAHRALADAIATAEILHNLIAIAQNDIITYTDGYYSIPDDLKLKRSQFDELPNGCGIFWFSDQDGSILHVAKAKNIKQKAISKLLRFTGKKFERLAKNAVSVDYEVTGSYTLANLKEWELIKKHQPPFNRKSLVAQGVQYEGDHDIIQISNQNPEDSLKFHFEAGPTSNQKTLFAICNNTPVGYMIADETIQIRDPETILEVLTPIPSDPVVSRFFKHYYN